MITDASSRTASELEREDPAVWRARLVDAKCGNERAVVVLGFVHDGTLDPPRDAVVDDPEAICSLPPANEAVAECCAFCESIGWDDPRGGADVECRLCLQEALPPVWSTDVCWDEYTGDALPLARFIDGFGERGFRAHVCEPSYVEPFREAVGTIRRACDLI